jgi:NAD(P)-dependent dehydrogenase (short-subunit alcohol dehydrogenase family)
MMTEAPVARVALITGAGRRGGLGQAMARRLARDGIAIMLHDRGSVGGEIAPAHGVGTADDLRAICTELRAEGATVDSVTGDLLDECVISEMVRLTVERFGRLDILVNNAGVGYLFGPLIEMTAEALDAVLGVNLRAVILATKYAAIEMIGQASGGRIINIASQAGKSGFALATAYVASKHGVVGFTRSAALELGTHGITVNAICPNHVTTGLGAWQNTFVAQSRGQSVPEYLSEMRRRIPLGRVGTAEDTAEAAAFLCSAAAGYITAESLNVSGGEEYH